MFKPFKTPPTETGYYLWKNFNPIFENYNGLNLFYLYDNNTALIIGTDIKVVISNPLFHGSWLGPYEFNFIKRKVKNSHVLHHLLSFQTNILKA